MDGLRSCRTCATAGDARHSQVAFEEPLLLCMCGPHCLQSIKLAAACCRWCLSALALLGRTHWIDRAELSRFILFCQVHNGKLPQHARPESLLCYYRREEASKRAEQLGTAPEWSRLRLQDEHNGGISDRPEDACDVFHTFFGIGGLSLMGHPGLAAIDPAYALPVDTVQRLQARQQGRSADAGMAAASTDDADPARLSQSTTR